MQSHFAQLKSSEILPDEVLLWEVLGLMAEFLGTFYF
jgi:hypothetical protein